MINSKAENVSRKAMVLIWVVVLLILLPSICFSAARWDFNGTTDGWTERRADIAVDSYKVYLFPNVPDSEVEKASDPGFISPSLSLNASYFSRIKFNMASNCSDANGKIYFTTDSSSTIDEHKYVEFTVLALGPWRDYDIDMSKNTLWTGEIRSIRIDPGNYGKVLNENDTIGFDWIEISGGITGGVRENSECNDSPIDHVLVRLEQNNSIIDGSEVYTDFTGVYKITGILTGTYNLVALKTGYENSIKYGVSVVAGQMLFSQNIIMERKPPRLDSFAINSGASSTTSRSVKLNNTSNTSVTTDNHLATHYMASESSSFSGASWQVYSSSPSFSLSSGFGTKTVYLKLKNCGGESRVLNDTISYIPTPEISDNRSIMTVGEKIILTCDLGADGVGRSVAFFIDPGSDDTFSMPGGLTDSTGKATLELTAEYDWEPVTTFLCRDEATQAVSGWNASVDVLLPPPNLISPINEVTVSDLELSWSQVTYAKGYELTVDGKTVQIDSGSTTSYEADLNPGPHVWSAASKNTNGDVGEFSDSEQFTYEPPPLELVRPLTGDVVPGMPGNKVLLEWSAVSGAVGYRLFIDTLPEMDMPSGQTMYLATLSGTVHEWQACVLNSADDCVSTSDKASFTIQTPTTGFLARTVDDANVYWINYGKKWKLKDEPTFHGLGYSDSDVWYYGSGMLDYIPLGKEILSEDGRFVYRTESSPTVYLIRNGVSDWFATWDSFVNSEFGTEDVFWASEVGLNWIQSIYPLGQQIGDQPRIRIEPKTIYFGY